MDFVDNFDNFYSKRNPDGTFDNRSYNRVWKQEKISGAINLTKPMEIMEKKNIQPHNTTSEGHAKCITATYYKDGKCNIHGHHKGNAVKVMEDEGCTDVIETRYRIRKLTERECFRLMGVEDQDIDKIQSSGVSRSAQYKLAGNSIVVDCLYEIFKQMFVETKNPSRQLTLF